MERKIKCGWNDVKIHGLEIQWKLVYKVHCTQAFSMEFLN